MEIASHIRSMATCQKGFEHGVANHVPGVLPVQFVFIRSANDFGRGGFHEEAFAYTIGCFNFHGHKAHLAISVMVAERYTSEGFFAAQRGIVRLVDRDFCADIISKVATPRQSTTTKKSAMINWQFVVKVERVDVFSSRLNFGFGSGEVVKLSEHTEPFSYGSGVGGFPDAWKGFRESAMKALDRALELTAVGVS